MKYFLVCLIDAFRLRWEHQQVVPHPGCGASDLYICITLWQL